MVGTQDHEDQLLPIANVGRIMKQMLPPGAKISKEAKERMQECATEFVSFVTGEASDKCHKENRKTVNGDDICWALSTLGFDDYAEVIVRYLQKCREAERVKLANKNKVHEEYKNTDRSSRLLQQAKTAPTPTPTPNPTPTPTPMLEFRFLDQGSSSLTKPY